MSRASQELIGKLNHAMNREVSTALRYLLQSAIIKGHEWDSVRQMYKAEMADELGHAEYLADKIVMLGGTPRLDPDLTPPPSAPEQMLKNDIAQEYVDVKGYVELAHTAEKEGLFELKLRMEEQAADESRHAQDMERLLGN